MYFCIRGEYRIGAQRGISMLHLYFEYGIMLKNMQSAFWEKYHIFSTNERNV